MKERRPCIYKITNIKNKKVYIGQTNTTYHIRVRDHKWNLTKGTHSNEHLQNAWNKYGQNNFCFELLQECDSSELDGLEKFWIEFYDATNKKLGYNYESGGNERKVVHYLTRKKMSEISKKRAESKDYRKMMSLRTKKLWADGRYKEKVKRIQQISKDFICLDNNRIYYSMKELVEDLKVNPKSVYSACVGNQDFVISKDGKRYQIKYYEENKDYEAKEYKNPLTKSVICINTGVVFESARQAEKEMGVDCKSISLACNRKTNSAGKMKDGSKIRWAFYEDGKEYKISDFIKTKKHPKSKKVKLINTGEIFETMTQAAEKYNLHISQISSCCNGKLKTSGQLKDGTRLKWEFCS